MDERPRGRSWQAFSALGLMLIGVAGCSAPPQRGYQVQEVPDGFLFAANVDQGSDFPDRDILSQGMWAGDIETFEPQSQITVTRYAGNVSLAEAQVARDVQATRYGNPTSIDYGQVTTLTIDQRPAFAWMETRYDENDAVRSMDYMAVIPYDSVTYAVEFNTSVAARLHPDSLTRVVHSWGLGETVVLWGVILRIGAVLVGLGLLLAYRARRVSGTV